MDLLGIYCTIVNGMSVVIKALLFLLLVHDSGPGVCSSVVKLKAFVFLFF